ncbi:hypothetical protein H5410_008816 [Solanum commersonii]|uniref:Uncharacterized protein n=1 Tax=Solanum commersonii TaxID=4109 RepID=A0A9J6AHN7_SOLCO|nr:hypothetical protein H5410_008804 [Solanum commersonii]KAG5623598.1 hypothetical protein H5410_008816 [Solanum commersonii]
MGSLHNEGGVEEEKLENKNTEKEIPPLDVIKDYEDQGLIIQLEELAKNSYENDVSIDFNAMFSDFFPEDEEMALAMKFYHGIDDKDVFDPPVVLPIIEPSFMKYMEIDCPEEFKLDDGEPSLGTDRKNWDDELMKWIWHPNSYEEFLRFYEG